MALTVAIQMDPVERIDIVGDSTFALALEAQSRGHTLLYYGPRDLTLRETQLVARVRPLVLRNIRGDHFTLGDPSVYELSRADVVLMRQDPPFDMAYITATHMLERIHPKTLVVNDPFHVRNAPEKLFVTQFEGLMPPTLITSDRDEIRAFRTAHKDIVIKPLYGNGGAGVFRLKSDDENLNALLEMFTQFYREPVELSPRDRAICAAIGPALKERGLIFAGIDVIGDYLTEINVTSPTGIQELRRFGGADAAQLIWDAIERRIAAARGSGP